MADTTRFFIDGSWVDPVAGTQRDVVNPATLDVLATISLGGAEDVDRAVASARSAAAAFAETTPDSRIRLLERILERYVAHAQELARTVSREMGAPIRLARTAQVPAGMGHLVATIDALRTMQFEEPIGSTTVVKEPIGVCALITPWNWPLNQIVAKVAPAIAAGCAMVLKPSETAPLNAMVFADIMAEAGAPEGVFNLVNGDGPTVGSALACHRDVDMISFTGSNRAGVDVARNAATTVKRVAQELGGKSANIVLDDADIAAVVSRDLRAAFTNSGQSCNAGTRILVPEAAMAAAMAAARSASEAVVIGAPDNPRTDLGPVVSEAQHDKIQGLIRSGIQEGATLVVGGPGHPSGLERGYYVRPTVFADVHTDMRIAREEIFGPVVVLIGYRDEDEAIAIANSSEYGLSGYVSSSDPDRARSVARRLRTGMVHLNGAGIDPHAPFGGYKRSGNGREFGRYGIEEFLEVKSIFGYGQV